MNSTARDTLPTDATELNKLAHLMHAESGALLQECETALREVRRRFEELFAAEAKGRG